MLPEAASSIGPQVDRLFWIILFITGFFFVLVQIGLLVFILKYRAGSGRKAAYLHGNNAVEIVWTVIPALILVWLTLASQKTWAEIRTPIDLPASAPQVRIQGEQFAWNIQYPGPDRIFDTEDDITTINQLHLPVGETAALSFTSKDVIHSFFVPEFRTKQDTVPGMTIQLQLTPTRRGDFEIRCAELCGLGHYRMRGFVKTESRLEFETWLQETKANE